jgi:hypothetical protein
MLRILRVAKKGRPRVPPLQLQRLRLNTFNDRINMALNQFN